jgi:hypothetical protein
LSVSLGTDLGKCFWSDMKRAVTVKQARSSPARPARRRTFPGCSPCFSRVLQRKAASPLRPCHLKNSVPQWGAESSLAWQWLPAAGGDGAWTVRTGSWPMRMCGDIFAAVQLWRGRLLTTGHLSSRHPVVVGAGNVSWGSLRQGGRKRGRAPGAVLPSACEFSAV